MLIAAIFLFQFTIFIRVFKTIPQILLPGTCRPNCHLVTTIPTLFQRKTKTKTNTSTTFHIFLDLCISYLSFRWQILGVCISQKSLWYAHTFHITVLYSWLLDKNKLLLNRNYCYTMILFKYKLKYSFYYKDKGDEMEKRISNCSCNFLEAMCNLFYCIPKVKSVWLWPLICPCPIQKLR